MGNMAFPLRMTSISVGAESASFCSVLLSRQIQSCVRCALFQNPRSYLLIFPQQILVLSILHAIQETFLLVLGAFIVVQDWTLACGYAEDARDLVLLEG
nr:hypothetical protein CFP56_02333 [Quercus suber]